MVLQWGEEAMLTGTGIFISWLSSSSDTSCCLSLSSKMPVPAENSQCNLCWCANVLSGHNPDYCKYKYKYIKYACIYTHMYIHMYLLTHSHMCILMHPHILLSVVMVQINQLYDQRDNLTIDNINRGIAWCSGTMKKGKIANLRTSYHT